MAMVTLSPLSLKFPDETHCIVCIASPGALFIYITVLCLGDFFFGLVFGMCFYAPSRPVVLVSILAISVLICRRHLDQFLSCCFSN